MANLSQSHLRSMACQAGARGAARAPVCEKQPIVAYPGSSPKQLQGGLNAGIAGCKLGVMEEGEEGKRAVRATVSEYSL